MAIISHLHRFVFVAVPKTGTHSIRFALRGELGPMDEEQVVKFVERRLSYPELSKFRHGHLSARDLRRVLGEDIWRRYFSFAVVRNPWDRFVSYCAFLFRKTDVFEIDPKHCMRQVLVSPEHHQRILFRPQCELVTDEQHNVIVDRVCHMERMQDDFDEVCERLGLPKKPLERINPSSHRNYRDYYDRDLANEVGEVYRRDVEIFGYEF